MPWMRSAPRPAAAAFRPSSSPTPPWRVRRASPSAALARETGGLSGRPLFGPATRMLAQTACASGTALPLDRRRRHRFGGGRLDQDPGRGEPACSSTRPSSTKGPGWSGASRRACWMRMEPGGRRQPAPTRSAGTPPRWPSPRDRPAGQFRKTLRSRSLACVPRMRGLRAHAVVSAGRRRLSRGCETARISQSRTVHGPV